MRKIAAYQPVSLPLFVSNFSVSSPRFQSMSSSQHDAVCSPPARELRIRSPSTLIPEKVPQLASEKLVLSDHMILAAHLWIKIKNLNILQSKRVLITTLQRTLGRGKFAAKSREQVFLTSNSTSCRGRIGYSYPELRLVNSPCILQKWERGLPAYFTSTYHRRSTDLWINGLLKSRVHMDVMSKHSIKEDRYSNARTLIHLITQSRFWYQVNSFILGNLGGTGFGTVTETLGAYNGNGGDKTPERWTSRYIWPGKAGQPKPRIE